MLSVSMTLLLAYPMSIKGMFGRKAVNYYVFVARSFFEATIPEELREAAASAETTGGFTDSAYIIIIMNDISGKSILFVKR